MELEQCERLSQLVEDLTTSGEPTLNSEKLKELKKVCKLSEDYIKHVYHLIMTQLNKDHAEIRLAAFQIVNELFVRSHQFRTLLVSDFQEFLELTVETDFDQPLPPPKEVAQKLKQMAIISVQEWQEKYGDAYKKLSLGYHFLKHIKKVDFQDVRARTQAERKREEERQRRLENINKVKVKRVEEEMGEMIEEMENCLTELEACFHLLMPHLDEFTINGKEYPLEQEVTNETDQSNFIASGQQDVHSHCTDLFDDEQPCSSKDLPPLPSVKIAPENQALGEKTESPQQDESSESEEFESDEENEEAFIRNHGLVSHKYFLNLEIDTGLKVREDEDNTAVVSNIKDFERLVNKKYLPTVQYWIQVFTKAGVHDGRLKQAIDLKNAMETAIKKHEEMNINYKNRNRKVMKATDEDEDDDDADFVEVPEKEGYEPHIPDHLREEYGLEPQVQKSEQTARAVKASAGPQSSCPQLRPPRRRDEDLDPTCAAATLKILKKKLDGMYSMPGTSEEADIQPSTSADPGLSEEHGSNKRKREQEKEKAPVMPFGLDLYYWGKEQSTAGQILKVDSQHRFWRPKELEEEFENKELAAMLKTRYITFAGKFQPVNHKCQGPMPDGTLCQRQDRFKCPFHGKIIPRDEQGNPTNPEDIVRLEKEKQKRQEEQPDWRDPELMREIEAAKGVNLGSSKCFKKGKKGKGKKRKYPNLTDLKQQNNTSRSRLEKHVFNKMSVKRVSEALTRIDKRKHEKFANQFNYALH